MATSFLDLLKLIIIRESKKRNEGYFINLQPDLCFQSNLFMSGS